MAVVNLHTRKIDATASEVGAALGSLGSDTDKLWPRHLLVMRLHGLARLTWPLAIRWLHDAAIEDSLNHAERAFATTIHKSARWSGVARLLRAVSLNADRKSQK